MSNPKADFLEPGERPTTMMAAVIDATGGPEVLHLAEVPLPIRINAEVLVKVGLASHQVPVDPRERDRRCIDDVGLVDRRDLFAIHTPHVHEPVVRVRLAAQ